MEVFKVAIYYFINVLYFLIIVRAVMSWFIRDLGNPIVRFVYELTEPLLSPFRKLLNSLGVGGTMIDFSPLLLFIVLTMIMELVKYL